MMADAGAGGTGPSPLLVSLSSSSVELELLNRVTAPYPRPPAMANIATF